MSGSRFGRLGARIRPPLRRESTGKAVVLRNEGRPVRSPNKIGSSTHNPFSLRSSKSLTISDSGSAILTKASLPPRAGWSEERTAEEVYLERSQNEPVEVGRALIKCIRIGIVRSNAKVRCRNPRQRENKSTPKHQKNHHGLGPPSAPRFIPKEQTVRPSASRGGHYSTVHPQIPR